MVRRLIQQGADQLFVTETTAPVQATPVNGQPTVEKVRSFNGQRLTCSSIIKTNDGGAYAATITNKARIQIFTMSE